jgi:hypothetical protein
LKEYFPPFVREKLIREVLFNFRQEGKSVRDYTDRVFLAAKFLRYGAEEQQ